MVPHLLAAFAYVIPSLMVRYILSQPDSDMLLFLQRTRCRAVPSIMSTQPRSHHLSNTLSYSQHEQALAAARDQSELGMF